MFYFQKLDEKPQRASRSTKIKSKKYCPTDSSSENNNSQSEDSSSSRSRSRSRSTISNKSEQSNKSDSRNSSVVSNKSEQSNKSGSRNNSAEAKPPIPVDETINEHDKQIEHVKQKSRTPSPMDAPENELALVIDEDSPKVTVDKPKKKEKKPKKCKREKKQTQTESLEDMTKMIEDRLADLKSVDSRAKEEALQRKMEMKQIKEVIAKKKALDKAKKAHEKETKGKKTSKRQPDHEVSPQRRVIEDERSEHEKSPTRHNSSDYKPERKVIFAEDNKMKKELISTEIVMQISPEDKFSDSDDDTKEEEAPVVTKHYLMDALNKQKEHCAMLEKYNKDLHESVKKHTIEKKVCTEKATKEAILLIKEVSLKSLDPAARKLRPCNAFNNNSCTESEPESDKFGVYCNRIVGEKITKFLHCCCFCRSKTGRINKHPTTDCLLAQKYKHLFMEEDKLAEAAQPEKAKRKFTPITAPNNDSEAKKLKKEVPTNTTHATTSNSVTGIMKQPKPATENVGKQGGNERPEWVSDLFQLIQPLTKAVKESNERSGRPFNRGRGRGRGRGRARSKSVDRSGN